MKLLTLFTLCTFFMLICASFAQDQIIPVSEVEDSVYRLHLAKAFSNTTSLVSESLLEDSDKKLLELERIGFRVGVGLEVGLGPFSIEGEMQHRFIFKVK
jgi:hypothetical protein